MTIMAMLKKHNILTLLAICCWAGISYAQNSESKAIEIKRLAPNEKEKALFVEFSAIENGSFAPVTGTDLEVVEIIDGQQYPMEIVKIDHIDKFDEDSGKGKRSKNKTKGSKEEVQMLFLIDRSGSMRKGNAFDVAKEAVRNVVKNLNLPENDHLHLASFHNDIFDTEELSRKNVDKVLSTVNIEPPGKGKDTDLHRAIVYKLNEFKKKEGKKILVVLTDGANDIKRNPFYKIEGNNPIPAQDVLDLVASMDSNTLVFPVGLGPEVDTDFLKSLADSSKSTLDGYKSALQPQDLNQLFAGIVLDVASNNAMYLTSQRPVFIGNERELILKWKTKNVTGAPYQYSLGTSGTPVNLGNAAQTDLVGWGILFFLGLLAVGSLFALLSIIIPIRKQMNFKKQFIKPYKEVKKDGIREMDPISMMQFEDDDMVVVKCSKTLSLDTWKACGNQCPYYPDCIGEEDCKDGEGMGKESFFSQNRDYKQFNWIWFGAVGGMVGWAIFAIFQNIDTAFHVNLWSSLVGGSEGFLSNFLDMEDIRNSIESLSSDTIEGFALGIGLGLALTFVEELGQSRKRSWGRIIFRALLIGVISYLIFALGFFIEQWLKIAWIGGGVKAVLFGITLGATLSIKSTISTQRGILGGLIAAVIGFAIYFLISQNNLGIAKLISFLLLGSILGFVIVSVVSRVEDFKLEYLEPAKYRRTNPISKWLKTGIDIEIGSDPGCYVFVKWTDDSVKPKHAKLSFDGKSVKIYPYHEVLINSRVIPTEKEYVLSNNDIIRLGTNSITKMRYLEERGDGKPKGRQKKEKAAPNTSANRPKPSIKITRRV